MNALEITNLTKTLGDFTLDNLNLTLPQGCIMGLIGENGAGKSTTIKLILDILHKDRGEIKVLGRDNTDNLALTKEDIGVVFDEIGIPDKLTVTHVDKIMQGTFKNWDSEKYHQLLSKFSLPEKKAFKDFSRGMKMKLGIAIAMSHNSKLLLLDEATSGLDPVIRDEVVDMLTDFTRDETHSVLISSHIVSDLEKLCDYVAFLHKGRLLICEEKDKLLERYCIVNCTAEQLSELDSNAVKYKKVTPYGVSAMVLRDSVPHTIKATPISIEELFVFMVKEENGGGLK